MTRISFATLLLTGFLISSARAQAPDATEPIKPFVNELTVAAARLDLSAINFDAMDRWSQQVLDSAQFDKTERAEIEQDLRQSVAQARQFAADLKKAGGGTLWVIFSIESLPDAPVFMVVPTGPGVDVQQVRKLLSRIAPGGPDHAEILEAHNALIIPSDRRGLEWIRNLKPAPRPELATALSAAGDGPLQIALVPSSDARKVVESMSPSMPDGQSAAVLARNFVWAAVTLSSPPDVTGRLIVKSPDQQAAAALVHAIQSLATWAQQAVANAKAKHLLNSAATLVNGLRVQGDRVELTVDAKQSVSIAAEISLGLHVSRQVAARTQSASNIKQLMLGCMMYAYNDVQHLLFPETFAKMTQQQHISPQVMTDPNRPNEKPGYIYVRPPEPVNKVPAERLVIYENFKDFDGGVNVGFGDGHVEFISNEAQFHKLLDEAQQKQKEAGAQK